MDNTSVYRMCFASVDSLYIQKAQRKGRTKEEVDTIIFCLTGYNEQSLNEEIGRKNDLETFYSNAPQMNPDVSKIKGMICGYRVEEMDDQLRQKVRYLDKLINELAKGKTIAKILRKGS